MTSPPVDELINEVSYYIEQNRNTLPDTQVRLLRQSLDHLKRYRAAEKGTDLKGMAHAAEAVYWLTKFLTDRELPNFSELIDAVEQLL